MSYRVVARMVAVVILATAAVTAATAEEPGGRLSKYLPGYEIARYLPADGRLVLEHGDELFVLRKGDEVPGRPGVRLAAADRRGALLVETATDEPGPEAVPRRWLRLVPDGAGGAKVIAIERRPEEGLQPETDVGRSVLPTAPVAGEAETADGGGSRR